MAYLGENIKKLGFGLMRLPQDMWGHILMTGPERTAPLT